MVEYIERDMIYEYIERFYSCHSENIVFTKELLQFFISKFPVADVAPVRHGHWIEQCEESLYSCSACGTEWITIEGTPKENGMDFCPHCGAKMDEKECNSK